MDLLNTDLNMTSLFNITLPESNYERSYEYIRLSIATSLLFFEQEWKYRRWKHPYLKPPDCKTNQRTGNKHINRDIRPSAMCDTLTGQKARLICAAGPAPCVIGGTLMRDEPCVHAREHACTVVYVHASDGACICYEIRTGGQDDGRRDARGNREWWLARHKLTLAHAFQARTQPSLSLSFSRSLFPSSTGFLPVSSCIHRLRRCTTRVRMHDGLACLDRPDTFLPTIDLRCTWSFYVYLESFRN